MLRFPDKRVRDYCVIGNGLIGAAVALELAQKSRHVCVLGAVYGDEGKYYSSHEDDSRIARCWHSDPYWEDLARRNFEKLSLLVAATGVAVFRSTPVFYRYSDAFRPGSSVRRRALTNGDNWTNSFDFEDECGGIIEPKLYIAALNREAERRGAEVVRCVVRNVRWKNGNSIISTSAGEFECGQVVDARGFMFQESGVKVEAEVVGKILLYVESQSTNLDGPFCFVDCDCGAEEFQDMYGIVSYKASDGRTVSKFGFSERHPVRLRDTDQISAWFQAGYKQYPYLGAARSLVDEVYAGLANHVDVKPCAFAVTANKRPGFLFEEQHAVVTGCNGMAAKCCQALAEDFVSKWEAMSGVAV
jgi:hypothetical protein